MFFYWKNIISLNPLTCKKKIKYVEGQQKMVYQNSNKVLSLILLSALLVLVVILWVQSYYSSTTPTVQKENMTFPDPPTPPPEPSSGIARCKYGGYTPILTCSYQAFRHS
jgi:hypothetical protein